MTWLDRTQGFRSSERSKPSSSESAEEPPTRRSPGLAALFEGLYDDGRHSILDLGPANGRQLRLLGRFGRRVRFAGLVPRPPDDDAWLDALRSLPPHPERPYDVVLLWDVLDRLPASERGAVVDRITEITAPQARLYTVVDASGATTTRPLAFTIVDLDRVSQEAVGPPEPAHEQILPAKLERILSPFEVVHAFTLRGGLREYVALKSE